MDFTISLQIFDDGTSRSRRYLHGTFFLTAGTKPAQRQKRHTNEGERGQPVHQHLARSNG